MIIAVMLMKQHRKCFISYVILKFKEYYVCVCMGCEGIINAKYFIFYKKNIINIKVVIVFLILYFKCLCYLNCENGLNS